MCGIVAVVRRKATRTPPSANDILALLQPVPGLLDGAVFDDRLAQQLGRAADALDDANALLSGVPGVHALLFSPDLRAAVHAHCLDVRSALNRLDAELDSGRVELDAGELE